jgi:hypothetical protein
MEAPQRRKEQTPRSAAGEPAAGSRPGGDRCGPGDVGRELGLEVVERLEAASVTEPREEVNVETLPVEIAIETDAVDLDGHARGPERHVRADVDRGWPWG